MRASTCSCGDRSDMLVSVTGRRPRRSRITFRAQASTSRVSCMSARATSAQINRIGDRRAPWSRTGSAVPNGGSGLSRDVELELQNVTRKRRFLTSDSDTYNIRVTVARGASGPPQGRHRGIAARPSSLQSPHPACMPRCDRLLAVSAHAERACRPTASPHLSSHRRDHSELE